MAKEIIAQPKVNEVSNSGSKDLAATPKKDYSNPYGLKPLDVVSMTGVKNNLFHKIIRWKEAGFKNRNNLSIPVHTGIVVPMNGKLKIVEMKIAQGGGIKVNPVEQSMPYFKNVTRFKLSDEERNKTINAIQKDVKRGVGYAMKPTDVARFIIGSDTHEKKELKRAVCSEYVARKIDENTKYNVNKVWHKTTPADLVNPTSFDVKIPKDGNVASSEIKVLNFDRKLKKVAASKFDKGLSGASE